MTEIYSKSYSLTIITYFREVNSEPPTEFNSSYLYNVANDFWDPFTDMG